MKQDRMKRVMPRHRAQFYAASRIPPIIKQSYEWVREPMELSLSEAWLAGYRAAKRSKP